MLRRRPEPVSRASSRPHVPADEPPHSEACYCPVISVLLVPCSNCRRDAPAPGGGS